jgi:hypothetical protein
MTDTYTIKFSSDADTGITGAIVKPQFTVGPTTIDTTSTTLTIHGMNTAPFGEALWTNLVHMLENFCSAQGPTHSTLGQLWFDTTSQSLKVRRLSSAAPYSPEWALVSPFNGSSSLTVPLITSLADNNITGDTSAFDNYFVTKGYSDSHYLPRGNFVAGTDALSKYKLKYSTDVTFVSGDTTALVTKKYVDDLVGIVDTLSIDVQVDGSMIATKPLLGSLDNFIPAAGNVPSGNTPAFDNYFVTRGYADQRYLREGVFDNDNRRISVSKIQYTSDAIYAASGDDYTLVHKKFMTDYVTSQVSTVSSTPAWLNVSTQPSLGVLWSDGTNPISSIPIDASNTSGQVLAINSSKDGFEWITPPVPNNLPSWLSTTPTGVLVGNGTTVSGLAGASDKQLLSTKLTGTTVSYEWNSLSGLGLVTTTSNPKGFLYSSGTAISSSNGNNDTVLTINSTGVPEWVAKSSLVGSGSGGTPNVVGVGSWVNVMSSRTPNTPYTNNDTGDRIVNIVLGNSTPNRYKVTVDGINVGETSNEALENITFVVPPGGTYKYENPNATATNGEIRLWSEYHVAVPGTGSGPSGLNSLMQSPGYQIFPNGFIMQWGYVAMVAPNTAYIVRTLTLPKPMSANSLYGWSSSVRMPSTTTTGSIYGDSEFQICDEITDTNGNITGVKYFRQDLSGYDGREAGFYWLVYGKALAADIPISSGGGGGVGGLTAPAAGIVTSTGTTLNGTAYGANNYLLASTGAGLRWVDPSKLGGGSSSMINSNAIAVHDPGTKTLPATQTTEKTGSQWLLHDGSNSSYASLSAPTQLISLQIPAVTVDTMVSITVGFKTKFTGSAPICVHYIYVDINGTSIRRVGSSETFMTTLRAGASYTMNLSGQYTCALSGISTAVATVSDMFIEVLAVGGTLTGISSGGGSGGASAVVMVQSTVATKTNTALATIATITIPASLTGTPVDYWITGGTGSASTTPQAWSIASLTIKNGTEVIAEGNINSSGSGWSGAGRVTVSTVPVTITMAGTGAGSITYRNNYLTATATSGSGTSSGGLTAPTAGIVTSNGTVLSSTNGIADQLLAINSTNTGYTWIDKSTLVGSGLTAPTAGIVTSNGTSLAGTALGANNYLLASTGTSLTWVNPSTLVGSGGGSTSSRTTIQGTTGTIAAGAIANLTLVGFKGYALYKVSTNSTVGGAWVRIYSSKSARAADASRALTVDPSTPGVIAEVITTSNTPVLISPGVVGFNDETTPTTDIELAVTNTNTTSGSFTVYLTLVKLES